MKPIRIQRKRTVGWKMPPNTISVTRPGKWGNHFKVEYGRSAFDAVQLYEDYVNANPDLREKIVLELQGKNLACFCKLSAPCHADILLKIANEV